MWHASQPALSSQPIATLKGIPSGAAGTAATLQAMAELARAAVKSPYQAIREKAIELTRFLEERNWMQEIRELHAFVRDSIRYLRDPALDSGGPELVQTPEKTLEYGQGDCDDKSTLLAALLTSIGHPARFVAVAFNGSGFSHVLVETKVKNTGNEMRDWLPLETIIQKEAGWYPPGVTSRLVRKV